MGLRMKVLIRLFIPLITITLPASLHAVELPVVPVEGQPLAANVERLIESLEYLGHPMQPELVKQLQEAGTQRDAHSVQRLLDQHVLLLVSLNPEVRVKVQRGPAQAVLQQGGFAPVIVKVINDSTVTRELKINSPQAGAVYSGAAISILKRQAQTELNDNQNLRNSPNRFLELEMFHSPPMTAQLSGLPVEYAIALIYSHESGQREATIEFDVGAGTQDIGFRGQVPILFDVQPAMPVKLRILDHNGTPTTARLTFRDQLGHVYPPQAKRLAPDFFFQPQIYRHSGESVLLPPGKFSVQVTRGPEYETVTKEFVVTEEQEQSFEVKLKRWIEPTRFGYYCGDHHIHGAGCSHYTNPTQGVSPEDMFRQVKGEGLNVGCVLTWGPCFDFQRRYFSPQADAVSEPLTLLKYDLEISGFGSAALGHVCLLNLTDQTYPGTNGTTANWPTWTVPVMRWCKEQGGVTGYPHSAMHVNPAKASERLLHTLDRNKDRFLSPIEAKLGLLPQSFTEIDQDRNGWLSGNELKESIDEVADELPNYAVPEMNGGGALEICVTAAEGVCDFISAMDTARIPEWNTWYHLLNCGIPMKLSGETDFPCMSSRRVGQGRVYVQLGEIDQVNFKDWCDGIARGDSYVSDGYSHALGFQVNGTPSGRQSVELEERGNVRVSAQVAFAATIPKAVAYGNLMPGDGPRMLGDTVNLHAPRSEDYVTGGDRLVELIVNGQPVAKRIVPADGQIHDLTFDVEIKQSSWVALRQFPQLHTNPVNVIVAGKPIRASSRSALWCAETILQLWRARQRNISPREQPEALRTYNKAVAFYQQIAEEAKANEPNLIGSVRDAETGESIPARLYIRNERGESFLVESSSSGQAIPYKVKRGASEETHTTLSADPFEVRLKPGKYFVTAEAGKEYLAVRQVVVVTDAPIEIELQLRRWINMAELGWFSGETHIHRKVSELPLLMLAENLNVGLPLTAWVTDSTETPATANKNQDAVPPAELIKVDETHVIWPVNTEYEIFSIERQQHTLGAVFILGHQDALHLKAPPVKPIADEARKQGALLDLDKHNWPWSMMLIPVMDVDLYELTNNHIWRTEFLFRNWYPEYLPKYMGIELGEFDSYTEREWIEFGLQNYYALLNCGFDLKPSAGTASGVHPVPLGFGRVYVHQPDGFSYENWMAGLAAGRSFVSTGPMLFLKVDGHQPGSEIMLDAEHTANIVIRGLSPMTSNPDVELVVNGEIINPRDAGFQISTERTPTHLVYEAKGTLQIKGSSWITARFFQVEGDRPRFAHTATVTLTDPQIPLTPRIVEVDYLIKRIDDELQRHADKLSPAALDEYRSARKFYTQRLKSAR